MLSYKGRTIAVPEAGDGVARFSFADLCEKPLGAGDYLTIADAFHTIVLADVPVLGPARRNEAKRLINLIDTLYDRRIRLVVSAEAEPVDLWRGEGGADEIRDVFRRQTSVVIRHEALQPSRNQGLVLCGIRRRQSN